MAEYQVVHRASGNRERTETLGPYRLESLLSESEEQGGTAYRVSLAPHQTTATSFHQIAEEFYFVLAGSGKALLDGQEYVLRTGDFLRLPPGTRHSFVTAEQTLELLDIHLPGCRPNRDTFFMPDTAGKTSP